MGALETATRLASFDARGPGTNAERRAANWVLGEITARGRDAYLEPFWCRPSWPLAHAWHFALAVAGSLVAVGTPKVGGAMVLVALLGLIADATTGRSPGRRLTPERASQNVVSRAPDDDPRVRLIVTASYDTGRCGLLYRRWSRGLAASLHRAGGGVLPGWQSWAGLTLVVLLVDALRRNAGHNHDDAAALLQLIPTVILVVAFALLIELAIERPGPGAGDAGSAAGIALALVQALDVAPPANVAVELVLAGAGEGPGIGLRHHLRARRPKLKPPDAVVLGIAPCGSGHPRWWLSDGALLPLRYLPRLQQLSAEVAAADGWLQARPFRGRGAGPALPARARGLPAITIGCLDEHGLVPYSHSPEDSPDKLDPDSLESALSFVMALVDAVDAEIGRRATQG